MTASSSSSTSSSSSFTSFTSSLVLSRSEGSVSSAVSDSSAKKKYRIRGCQS